MLTDLEIARSAKLRPLTDVAADLDIPPDLLEPYGRHAAKVDLAVLDRSATRVPGRYVVVTAMTPTPLGEGKTTVAVGLGQAMRHLDRRGVVAVRQPSQGPTFGIKGGAAGGGHSQVVPMEVMNLHLTGDIHAVTAAHNLLAAMVDNHLFHGNQREIDTRRVAWRRVLDVNDRALRNVVVGLGAPEDGVPRQSGFDITAASEVMAILALTTSLPDLRDRLGRIVVGTSSEGKPVTAEDIGAAGAMAVLLREAIKPNLLQTLEGTPVLVHAGPFANIATGTSSVLADLVGIRGADVVITEAGFGADIGAEKLFDIKCRTSGLAPDAAVVVATIRALKAHSGQYRVVAGRPLPDALLEDRPEHVEEGLANLRRHIENVRRFGVTPVVAINVFPDDHPRELAVVHGLCAELGVRVAECHPVTGGGEGCVALAEAVLDAASEPSTFHPLYPLDLPLAGKIEAVATRIYGADGVTYTPAAQKRLAALEADGFGELPVCLAKTHLSFSHDPKLLGAPTGWTLPVREVRLSAGAGFVYPLCGEMRTMPGLSSHPAAETIDIDASGNIVGLS
jgi:formate--tetrahydrofolate ligase